MDPTAEGPAPAAPKNRGLVARVDHGVYVVERAVAWGALLVMAAAYFLAIVERELSAGPGQNAVERFVLKRMGETTQSVDPAFLARLHEFWAPLIAFVGLLTLIVIGAITAKRAEGKPRRLVVKVFGGVVAAAAVAGLTLWLPSRWLCLSILLIGFGWALFEASRRGGAMKVALRWTPAVAAIGYFFLEYIEAGYSWHKELSMVLLMWVGFVGASMATYEERNIQVDFVRKNVPAGWLRWYEAFGSIVTAFFTLILAALAYDTVRAGLDSVVPLQTIRIPGYLVPLPIALGFITIAARYILRTIRLLRGTEKLPGLSTAPEGPRTFFIIAAVLAVLALLSIATMGTGAWLAVTVLALLLVGAPLYVLIGGLALACFALWPDIITYFESFEAFSRNFNLMARMRDLADQESLIAIPFFMIAGAIMSRGAIAGQLVECARAAFGWLPGGLAISTVMACMFFAAISGSSPVTVITIGAIMVPALKNAGYPEKFSLGLVTSAGSLGIIIPPSIPMIVYSIFATMNGTPVDIKDLFIAGIGPGIVIAAALGTICVFSGRSIPTEPFELKRLGRAVSNGFWALFLPAFILIGIYFGVFNAIEASAIAVILALVIELLINRQLTPSDLPRVLADSASLMGSILVIISVALGLSEFLTTRQIPDEVVLWLASYELSPLGFVLLLNFMLILVGCAMDIISALILFVPLIIPLANQLGIDPIHLGLIFIVNLEIGYLTPPLGLNLFVASGFFEKPFGLVMRSVLPFIGALAVSLVVITAMPSISLFLVHLMHNSDAACSVESEIDEMSVVAKNPQRAGVPTCKPLWVPFPSGRTLKPRDQKVLDTTPTSFVAVSSDTPQSSGTGSPTTSLTGITNRSRVSTGEGTGELIDFDTSAVRGYAVTEGGSHQQTVVVITSLDENCGPEDAEPDFEEIVLRIVLPAKARADRVFDAARGEVKVELQFYEEGEITKSVTPDRGLVLVIEPERGTAIAEIDPSEYGATLGLFGAFELTFGADTLNGKFVVEPCEEGSLLYR